MNAKRQNYILVGAGVLCMIVAAVLLHSFKGEFGKDTAGVATVQMMKEDTIDASQAKSITEPERVASTPSLPAELVVHITGAVKKPGVYKLPLDSRVYAALNAAGGFSDKADTEAVNLAAKLADGMQVHFPSKGDSAKPPVPAPAPAKTQSAAPTAGVTASQGLVNINTATQKELEMLKGIGPKMAQSIIQYRAVNGDFARVEDLLLVKGIGAKKYDALKEMITVGK